MISYQEAVEKLKALQVDALAHRGEGNLLQHLEGTYKLLRKWDNPDHICWAGLYHSIYGTQTFTKASVDLNARDQVKQMIGPEAEQLAYWFSIQNQFSFLANLKRKTGKRIENRLTREPIEISDHDFSELLEIYAANELEQIPHMSSWKVFHFRWVKLYNLRWVKKLGQPFLSAKCFEDVVTCLNNPNDHVV